MDIVRFPFWLVRFPDPTEPVACEVYLRIASKDLSMKACGEHAFEVREAHLRKGAIDAKGISQWLCTLRANVIPAEVELRASKHRETEVSMKREEYWRRRYRLKVVCGSEHTSVKEPAITATAEANAAAPLGPNLVIL